MLRKRIKKNTLKWKKIYAEQLLDMMDEEENALQKIYLTGYVLELKKNRYFAGWYKDRFVCRSLEYARYFPSAEAAEEYVHKYLGFAGMTCYDFTPIISSAFDGWLLAVTSPASGVSDSHSVTGGVYKARERIHRGMLTRDY